MKNIVRKKAIGAALLFIFLAGTGLVFSSQAEAALSVTVVNNTGYDLSEVKYVREKGTTKSVVGKARQVANGGSHTFSLSSSGSYQVYASFVMDGRNVYAKGNANSLQDGGDYTLTLTKVIVSGRGTGINFIDQSEFDAIK